MAKVVKCWCQNYTPIELTVLCYASDDILTKFLKIPITAQLHLVSCQNSLNIALLCCFHICRNDSIILMKYCKVKMILAFV